MSTQSREGGGVAGRERARCWPHTRRLGGRICTGTGLTPCHIRTGTDWADPVRCPWQEQGGRAAAVAAELVRLHALHLRAGRRGRPRGLRLPGRAERAYYRPHGSCARWRCAACGAACVRHTARLRLASWKTYGTRPLPHLASCMRCTVRTLHVPFGGICVLFPLTAGRVRHVPHRDEDKARRPRPRLARADRLQPVRMQARVLAPRTDTRAIGALASRRSIGRAGVAPGRALRARGGTGPALARIGRCAACGSAHGAGPPPAELTGTEEHRIARAALARRRKIGHGAALAPELHARHSPLS